MEDPSGAGRRPQARAAVAGEGVRGGLLALATAAVVSVYAAGYLRTEAAAERFAGNDQGRGAGETRPVAQSPGASGGGPAPDPATGSNAPSSAPAGSSATAASTAAPTMTPASTTAAATTTAPASTTAAASTAPASTTAPGTSPAPEAAPANPPAQPPASTTTGADAPPSTPAALARAGGYKDGVYTGWGTSQHGRIEATVEVADGRIVTAKISSCRMRWPCARIAFLLPQPVERQSADVDVITRVTDSSDAFYYALVEALSKAK